MYTVIQDDVAVVTCGGGRYDLGSWTTLLRELNTLQCPTVIDLRGIDAGLSEIDTYLLALNAEDMPSVAAHRLALVTSGDKQCAAAFFAVCGQNRGLDVEVFDALDTAASWARKPTPADS